MRESVAGEWRDFCEKGQLAYQVSKSLGTTVFFPRVCAPGSGAKDLEWRISDGHGTVYASTTVRPRGRPPYNVSLIELDEGFRMMSRVEDVDPSSVRPGLRVSVRFADGLPVFAVEEGGR